MYNFYLVFWVDECIIQSLTSVSEVENLVESFSSVKILRRSHFSHPGELQPGQVHADGGDPVHIILLSASEAENIKGFVHDLHLLAIIDGVNLDFAHGHGGVVIDVVREQSLLMQVHHMGDHEVEDVVGSLTR